jgi:hypothetical protein
MRVTSAAVLHATFGRGEFLDGVEACGWGNWSEMKERGFCKKKTASQLQTFSLNYENKYGKSSIRLMQDLKRYYQNPADVVFGNMGIHVVDESSAENVGRK